MIYAITTLFILLMIAGYFLYKRGIEKGKRIGEANATKSTQNTLNATADSIRNPNAGKRILHKIKNWKFKTPPS